MEHESARDLLRASATDADAVRQYLQSIEADELNGLLDGIAPRDLKCAVKGKKKNEYIVQDDWLPLVHLLVHCETTRLRAASRIIQVLRQGSPSELENMQLLTEINLGYSSALDELQEHKMKKTQHFVKKKRLLDEIDVVLDIVFSFLEEVVRDAKPSNGKVLPQLLGLVPYFLGMSGELSGKVGTSENLAKLLELPWNCQTVPSLLDVLVEDSAPMSKGGWKRLQENVARMVTTSPEMASESINPLICECISVANVTYDHNWIGIARYLLRQLPVHLRLEAEFNLQMSFSQTPRIISLVCKSIQNSIVSEESDAEVTDPGCAPNTLKADWRDFYLLLHSLQASKPILHHRVSSSRVATEASVFTEIEQLAWWILRSDFEAYANATSATTVSQTARKSREKHALDQVESLLIFGGKQIYSREWKALLLMDLAFFWIEQSNFTRSDDGMSTQKFTISSTLLQIIFETAPETRAEVICGLFERSQKPLQRKVAGKTLSQLFESQSGNLFPHLNAIQDWLSLQFQQSFETARDFFLIVSRLVILYKDLYNFSMVFLRKLLSASDLLHKQFAVDIWCTWLEHRLPFDELQEEEIISALKTSVTACYDIQAWSFGRLEQVFQRSSVSIEEPAILLRKSSWEELLRFLSLEVGKFIVPTASAFTSYRDGFDDADEHDGDSGLLRFQFSSLDTFYQRNTCLDGAARLGIIFQKLLSCLIQFEKAAIQSKRSYEGLPIEGLEDIDIDKKQWLIDLVSNWKYFFCWICQDFDKFLTQSEYFGLYEKSAWWKLVARVYIGCGICSIAIEMLLWGRPCGDSSDQDMKISGHFESHPDNCEISVWSLMEVEFTLHRMIQKVASHLVNERSTTLSKEYVRAILYGLERVLGNHKLKLLFIIKYFLCDTHATRSPQHDIPTRLSFEATLFTLNSCCSGSENENPFGAIHSRDSDLNELWQILEILLCIYTGLRDRVVLQSDPPDIDDVEILSQDIRSGREKSTCGLQFSSYADSIASKFPTSARHLVVPGKYAKIVVVLDTKRGDEMLEHVCGAIGRMLDVIIEGSNVSFVHARIGELLRKVLWSGQIHCLETQDNDNSSNFGRLSRYLLNDVKACVRHDKYPKMSVSCASLSKRLGDLAAEISDVNVVCSDSHALSSVAYDILCDNVVYNARLLRLLLSICLSSQLALRIQAFATMENKIEGFICACGISIKEHTMSPKLQCRPTSSEKRTTEKHIHRKRLKQGSGARSSYERVCSNSESDVYYFSDPNEFDQSNESDLKFNGTRVSVNNVDDCDRIPHIRSHASRSLAVLAVLAAIEQSQTTLLCAINYQSSSNELYSFPHRHEILSYIRIHELVNTVICKHREYFWETRKVMLKVLHIFEMGMRIGKASGVLRKGCGPELGFLHDITSCLYESSVKSALTGRTWVSALKDLSQDSGTKMKVSALLLKMDIFFLQVPNTVRMWLKETSVSDEIKERFKALVAEVKKNIAPSDQNRYRSGKVKARQRLLGVIPMVKKRRKRLRSRHPIIDTFLNEENGDDAFADLEDFIE